MSGLGASVAQECYSKGMQEGKREGEREGRREGRREGIKGTVALLRGLTKNVDEIKEMIMSQFGLTEAEAEQYLK